MKRSLDCGANRSIRSFPVIMVLPTVHLSAVPLLEP